MKYLVKKAQKKDDQAFVELMERCKSGMYKVARSYLRMMQILRMRSRRR